MNTRANIEQLHADMLRTRAEILRITGIRENDLNDLVIDGGHEWLALITHNDARAMEFIPRTREFWAFWKRTWHTIDLAFITMNERIPLGRQAASLYYCMHRITRDNIHLNNMSVHAHYHLLRSMITSEKH